ncbi:hypothetical protein MMC18_002750 [Xylographa bjoerkii]|nr:hypothetical protein [Xylographa bjoerkii]
MSSKLSIPGGTSVPDVLRPSIEEEPVAVLTRLRDCAVRRRHQKNITTNKRATTATPPIQPPATAPVGTDCTAGVGEIAGCAIALDVAAGEEIDGLGSGELMEEGIEVEVDCDELEIEVDAELLTLTFSKAAAMAGFEDKKPAVRSPVGHPAVHGPVLQHPMNGGEV